MDKHDILKSIDSCANNPPRIVDITVHKHIEYANNLIITEASFKDDDLSFIGYSIRYEYPDLISGDEEVFHEYVNCIQPHEVGFPEFRKVFKSSILDKAIAHRVDLSEIECVVDLLKPDNDSYDMWFFLKGRNKKYCIFYDYCD
ncbi:MAG: hypothetical protein ABW104_07115 [Candidatus Thiodiazotropha sp. 6PLUC2]